MSTLTKEWLLKTIAELEEERDSVPGAVNEDALMALAAMKIALASLEAEPAIHRWRRVTVEPYGPYPWHYGNFIGFSKPVEGIEDEYFYSAPPAPVSVPDEIRLLQSEVTIWKDRWELLRELFREVADALGCDVKDNQAMLDKIEMLQGAAENSPVIPDGWVACSERMPEGMTDVHISNGHDVGQGWWDGDAWQTQHDYYSVPGDVTHWMPLPAAPQQEA
ncbi:DUF551 domain-containing protein [Enterobacter roggenkampii]|uniref:DUF551 domain-containing protein n=1 Tax=Enterobacter roggenkampii TaxID=1812935 RepID=UPI00069889DD|nr:DUF551 domain-containing protein [Enterobacter roggenkampii]WIJ47647.1 DUF551 domain-containing protein [Enterobacter roggenkampii]WIJ48819.1 DUF551 domain-containing protein [Enterobacter roggenkampii]WIJ77377.1 DUF551 domain-containing protein [Enterobacter roggenkampii]WIJ77791.1 DUF551 domain-containing protein [Enterobacter roggenkampii]WIJ78675.1 DUF551 domain-containing protein [Enterobacter roggenkampii]